MTLEQVRHIYFIGIGGMGMSALAWYFHTKGISVEGYDLTPTRVTDKFMSSGIKVYFQADPQHLQKADWIVYTPAIPPDHPELAWAREQGIPLFKRAEVLGLLSKEFKTLAVAGTHGKTTTSAMLIHLIRNSGVSGTAFLGGLSNNLHSNYVLGSSEYAVMEADEFDRSFLQLSPYMAIITALEADHLDCYGTEEELYKTYYKFAQASYSNQPLLIQEGLKHHPWTLPTKTYGIESGDFQAKNVRQNRLSAQFDFVGEGISLSGLTLSMPGHHNISNMTAALTAGYLIGLDAESMKEAVATFAGIYRRMDVQVDGPLVSYIDDYAHHPTEVAAAIDAARKVFPERKVLVVFQPHLYSRTQDHATGFAEALEKADEIVLLDIYPAREEPIPGVSTQLILDGMQVRPASLIPRKDLIQTLAVHIHEPLVILSLGAGDIDKEVSKIREWLVATLNVKS